MRQCEQMTTILKNIGYDCNVFTDKEGTKISFFDHNSSAGEEVLVTEDTAKLLTFLFLTRKLKMIPIKDEESESYVQAAPKETAPDFDKLRTRAERIGNSLTDDGNRFQYLRRRYLIPGTRYKFYFLVTNALNPKQPHFRPGHCYLFQKDELALVEAWIEHDEDIYAEANQTYGVQ